MNNIVVIIGVLVTVVTGLPVAIQLRREHPKGLVILFFAEMWERFSYYGMRGILVFYLTQHFLFDDAFATHQYASYTAMVYLLPLFGGIVADRWLGTRKAVAFGALMLVAGHLTMAYEGRPSAQTLTYAGHAYELNIAGHGDDRQVRIMIGGAPHAYGPAPGGGIAIAGVKAGDPLPAVLPEGSYRLNTTRDPVGVDVMYLALSLIIMGVTFLKPNISTVVGQLYAQGDPRRDAGFSLYYYGINLGSFWASVLCAYLGQTVGWWAGFGLAGVGMAAGFVVFVLGKPMLQGKGEPPDPMLLRAPLFGPITREWLIYGAAILAIPIVWLLVQQFKLVGWGLIGATILSLLAIGFIIVRLCHTRVQRQRMLLATILISGAVVFWTLFEQAGSSMNLFAERNTQLDLVSAPVLWNLLGLHVVFATPAQLAHAGIATAGRLWIDTTFTAAQTQAFNPGFILIFAPVFAALWAGLGRRGRDPDPTLKFGLGLFQAGLGFMVLVWGAGLADAAWRVPLMLLGFTYLLHTTGELCLSPVGMSEVTKLSLPSVVSFMMAVWFLTSSIAQYVGGIIAAMAGTETVGGQVLDPHAALLSSIGVFRMLAFAGMGFGVAFFALSFFIKGWAHEDVRDGRVAPEPIAPTLDGERQSVSPAIVRGDSRGR
jgi:POT family proton-dependent oligopeptide transporter